jgi:hypothetical protein
VGRHVWLPAGNHHPPATARAGTIEAASREPFAAVGSDGRRPGVGEPSRDSVEVDRVCPGQQPLEASTDTAEAAVTHRNSVRHRGASGSLVPALLATPKDYGLCPRDTHLTRPVVPPSRRR